MPGNAGAMASLVGVQLNALRKPGTDAVRVFENGVCPPLSALKTRRSRNDSLR
jgi:hypothetical protein